MSILCTCLTRRPCALESIKPEKALTSTQAKFVYALCHPKEWTNSKKPSLKGMHLLSL